MSRKALASFRRGAIKAYPLECLGFLIGKIHGSGLCVVSDIYVPPQQEATEDAVCIDPEMLASAALRAALGGKDVIGSIHTHTYSHSDAITFDPVPSIGDYKAMGDWERVIGVMNVYGGGRKRRRCGVPFFVTLGESLDLEVVA